MTPQIILYTTAFFGLILLCYYLLTFIKLASYKTINETNTSEAVSVIIAAKNEKHNLEKFLPEILNQQYPQFEVIVINDGSFDGTKAFLEEMQVHHPKLKIVTLNIKEQYQKGKKFALTIGIKAASYDQLLFTDADCKPSSPNWIAEMMSAKANKSIVLGYAPLNCKHNLLGAIAYYETFHTGLQYFSYALKGSTYMGVGRNLAYAKDLFFKVKGFASHQHIMSGDDDLFIQEVATKDNVAICVSNDSFMRSDAPKSLNAYIKQKKRHHSTSSRYSGKYKFYLGLYATAQILFFLLILANIPYAQNWLFAGIIMGVKWMVQWVVMFKPAKMLNAEKVAYVLPWYDVLFSLYLIFFALLRPFYKGDTWK